MAQVPNATPNVPIPHSPSIGDTIIESMLKESSGSASSGAVEQPKGPLTVMQPQFPTKIPAPTPMPKFNWVNPQDMQGVSKGNVLLGSLGGMVNNFIEHKQQEDIRKTSMDIQRLMGAMQGIQEAEASGNAQAVEANKKLVSEMFDGKDGLKRAKSIQKALNINLIGENKPETQAALSALKNHQLGEQVRQRLAASMPQTAQANPNLLAYFQMMKMAKDAGMVTPSERYKETGKDIRVMLTNRQREKIADMLIKERGTEARMKKETELEKVVGQKEIARIRGEYQVKAAQARASKTGTSDGDKKYVGNLATEMRSLNSELDKLQAERNKIWFWNRDQIKAADKKIEDVRNRQQSILEALNFYNSTGTKIEDAEGEENGGTNNSNSERTSGTEQSSSSSDITGDIDKIFGTNSSEKDE